MTAAGSTVAATRSGVADLLSRIAAVASRTPGAVAVHQAGRSLDYAGLVTAAGTVGWALRHLEPEARVGILLPRSPELVAALLGVLRAGRVAVPLDAAASRMRLRLQAADADLTAVLADATTQEEVAATLGVPVLRVDALPPAPAGAPPPVPHPDAAAVLVHSAGVEEEPRAVVLTHGNLTGLVEWLADGWPGGTFDRVRPDGPLDGPVAVGQVLASLARGGTVLCADRPSPTVHVVLSGSVLPGAPGVGTEGLLVLTGEPPTGALPQAAVRWSAWSAAETGGPVLAGPYADDDPAALGVPRPDTVTYVLDGALRPVPAGAVGRLHLGGGAVSRGYHAEPALTARRYLPDPFAAAPGRRMFATDDLVRRDGDGVLRRVGRVDECDRQAAVVTSPVPVQEALRGLAGVARAAVVRSPAGGFDAAVVPVDGAVLTATQVRAHLADLLPAALLPERLAVVEALPLLPSGKVNRRALSAAVVRAGRTERSPSRSEAEQVVERAWTAVLHRPVGVDRNFFDAGGDSLLMIKLSEVLRRAFGRDVDVVDLFRLPTIRAMAAHLSTAPTSAPAADRPAEPSATTVERPAQGPMAQGPMAQGQSPETAAQRQARARQEARRQLGRTRGGEHQR